MPMTALKFNGFWTSYGITAGQNSSSPYKLAADREYRHAVHRVEISTASDPWRTVAAPPWAAVMQRKRSAEKLCLAVSPGHSSDRQKPAFSGRSSKAEIRLFGETPE